MAIQTLDNDLNVIAALSDEPNDVDGLSSYELKARFDQSGLLIQQYINEILLPGIAEMEASIRQDATEYTNGVAANFAAGLLSPGSVTNEMLATPIFKTVLNFSAESWTENGDEYELIIPYAQHGITVPITYSIAHNIDDVYHNNTMAVNSVCLYRQLNNNLVLVGDVPFDGRLVIIS